MFTSCEVKCCVCGALMDWLNGRYGQHACCCCKECYKEFEWRRALAIMGKEYRPRDVPAPAAGREG